MDVGIPRHSGYECDLCASPAIRENGSDPRPRQMTSCDKNDVFHAVDPQAFLLSKSHTVMDIFDYPFTEIALSDCVLHFRWEKKI